MQELSYKRSEIFENNTDMGKVFYFFNHGILENYWNRVGFMLLQLADVRYLVEFFTHWVLGPW